MRTENAQVITSTKEASENEQNNELKEDNDKVLASTEEASENEQNNELKEDNDKVITGTEEAQADEQKNDLKEENDKILTSTEEPGENLQKNDLKEVLTTTEEIRENVQKDDLKEVLNTAEETRENIQKDDIKEYNGKVRTNAEEGIEKEQEQESDVKEDNGKILITEEAREDVQKNDLKEVLTATEEIRENVQKEEVLITAEETRENIQKDDTKKYNDEVLTNAEEGIDKEQESDVKEDNDKILITEEAREDEQTNGLKEENIQVLISTEEAQEDDQKASGMSVPTDKEGGILSLEQRLAESGEAQIKESKSLGTMAPHIRKSSKDLSVSRTASHGRKSPDPKEMSKKRKYNDEKPERKQADAVATNRKDEKNKATPKKQDSIEKSKKKQDSQEASEIAVAVSSVNGESTINTDSPEKGQFEVALTAQTEKREEPTKTELSHLAPTVSLDSSISRADIEEDTLAPEMIVWEWEQELDEYDEPDIYPSEKDYIMVPVQVEITEDEEELEAEQPAEKEIESEKEKAIDKNIYDAEDVQQKDTQFLEDEQRSEPMVSVQSNVMSETDPERDIAISELSDTTHTTLQAEESVMQKENEADAAKIEKAVDEPIQAAKIEEAVDEPIHAAKIEEAVDEPIHAAKIEEAVDEPVHAAKIEEVVDEPAHAAKTEEAADEPIHAAKIEEAVDEPEEETLGESHDVVIKDEQRVGAETEKGFAEYVDQTEEKEEVKQEEVKSERSISSTLFSQEEVMGPKKSIETSGIEIQETKGSPEAEISDKTKNEDQMQLKKDKQMKVDEEKRMKEAADKRLSERKPSKKELTPSEQGSIATTEDAMDQVDEFEVTGLPEVELEPVEPPPKRYKTVMVRTLVPRPPKIHYVPEEERKTHLTNDKHLFRKRPISLVMSYGYDCQRMANLHVLDKETVVFMSGFVLTFFNHVTKEQTFLRCIGGSCFGALAIHPSRRLFAAAEKGEKPIVGIWSWPKLQLFRKLREGTDKVYASVNFSPCGRFLATQGGEPDYLITVYNWLAEMPVVRVKSHAQDVYRVTFSKELAGRLTTAGLCHIKFWKMATTFTGLKLKGDIGRFGRTELSDIEGYVEMPDGKVLSGTEWGNLLLWENGLIVAEICIKPDIPCHEGIVRQVIQVESEFYTTGQDGWVRSWPFDTVDAAEINTTEESLKVAVKSSGQVLIKENSDIWFIVPDIPDNSTNSVFWFVQDGRGSILRADLSFLNTAKEPYSVFTAHGGPIVSCASSKINCIMATLGVDGQIRVYDYIRHKLLACRTFSSAGTTMMWPGVQFDQTCCTILAGFADGTFRAVRLSGEGENGLPMSLILQQVRKPHQKRLTSFDIDSYSRYLATGGEDGTIFFFDISDDYLPLLFIAMPEYKSIVSIKWTKQENKDFNDEEPPNKIIAALQGGTLVEFLMPNLWDFDNTISYLCTDAHFLRRVDFVSIKSELLHNEEIEIERLAEEQLNAAVEIENRKRIEEGLETESQQNIRLLEEAEEMERIKADLGPQKKWQPYKPPVPSPIMLMIPSLIDHDEVFLSMGSYDAGYLYLMRFEETDKSNALKENPIEPVGSTKIEDSRDKAITAYTATNEGDFVFWGFSDGRVRVQNVEYPYALEHIDKHWTEGIHDCVRGEVTSLCLDKDGVFLITTGNDGNCFLLSRMLEKELGAYLKKETLSPVDVLEVRDDVTDIVDPAAYTLEVYKKVEKEMALLAEAKKNKSAKREEIARLRIWYHDVIKKNNELPEEVRLSPVELALTNDRESRKKEEFDASLKQLKLETAWYTQKAILALEKVKQFYMDGIAYELFELRAFNSCCNVWSFRMKVLPSWFNDAKDKVETHVTPHSVDSDTIPEDVSVSTAESLVLEPKPKMQKGMSKFVHQKLVRIWERKKRKLIRAREWKNFLRTEPKSKDLKEEDKAIEEARANLGDMKLKSAADYKVPETKKLTEHRGRKRLVQLEEKMYEYKQEFNELMLKLRQDKIERLARMKDYKQKIIECQLKLSVEDRSPMPEIKPMVISEDPMRTLDYTVEDVKEYKKHIEEKLKAAAPVAKVVKKQEGPTVKRKGPLNASQRSQASLSKIHDKVADSVAESVIQNKSLGSYVEPIAEIFTPLEERIKRNEIIKAKFWQNHYINKIEEEKKCFDARLKLLRHRKLKLDFLLKTGEGRMTLLTQEFILAQQSEALEASLEMKIHGTSKEKRECSNVIKSLNKKLETIKKEMDAYGKQRNALFNEVIALAVSKAPAFEKYLVRVFSKRMPKVRSRQNLDRSEGSKNEYDSDDDESSEESDVDMDLSEDEDDGLDIDFPPQELSKEVYDR